MILDVTHRSRLHQASLELVEQVTRLLAEDVDQHVQPAAVRHADYRLDHAVGASTLQRFVQHRNQAVRAFEAEPLGSRILCVKILLEALGGRQPLQHDAFLGRVQRGIRARRFHAPAHPQLFGGIGDVHVLDPDRRAVGAFEGIQDVAQARRALVKEMRRTRLEHGVEIGRREAVIIKGQFRRVNPPPDPQRVQAGAAVTPAAVRGDQFQHAHLLGLVLVRDFGADLFRARTEPVASKPSEMLDDGAVRDIGCLPPSGQPVETVAPLFRDPARVVQERLVERLQVRRVAARKVAALAHPLNKGVRHICLARYFRTHGCSGICRARHVQASLLHENDRPVKFLASPSST